MDHLLAAPQPFVVQIQPKRRQRRAMRVRIRCRLLRASSSWPETALLALQPFPCGILPDVCRLYVIQLRLERLSELF